MERLILLVISLALTFKVAVSTITLECGSLQQLCPDDNQARMCVCNSTGNSLIWRTPLTGASGAIATFVTNTMVGTTGSDEGFFANLTANPNGSIVSTLTFNTSAVRDTGLIEFNVICEDLAIDMKMVDIAVTSAAIPGVREVEAPNVLCDPTTSTHQTTLQWNDGDTGGPDVSILYYLVEVTSSPPGFVCPPEQCNVTDSTTTITGLSCNTSYSFNVTAYNCIGSSNASMPHITTSITDPVLQEACFVDDNIIRITLTDYNTVSGNCITVNNFNISSNCSRDLINTDYGPGDTVANLTVVRSQSCEVTVIAVADCGYSEPATIIASGDCPSTTPSSTTPATSSSSSSMSTSDNTGTTSPTGTRPPLDNLGVIAGGAGGGAIAAIVAVLLVMATIFVCMFCPCACCMPCRRMCCGCCPEEKICYRWGSDDEYSEPTPLQEKQPVLQSFSTETKEKDVETGQPSYPSSAGPMYQDPNTIQRTAGPTGDLYAQPEKPARHQKQKPPPPMEMATYQDPNTIQRTAAPTTGDLYAQPDKPPKQPSGPAPVYSEVNKSNPEGLVYADLTHSEPPANARRREQVPDTTVYSEVSRH